MDNAEGGPLFENTPSWNLSNGPIRFIHAIDQ
jgi:hypothetical protein